MDAIETAEKKGVEDGYEERRDSNEEGAITNVIVYKDQLKRQYGLLGLCGLALNIDNAWIALGGAVSIAIANGGPPGVLYELIVACSYYAVIAACIAEVSLRRLSTTEANA